MQTDAPCESTATDNAGKRFSHFLPGRLPTLSSLKKLDRCAYFIPVLSSYDNELTALLISGIEARSWSIGSNLAPAVWPVSFAARYWTIKATRATNPFLVSRIMLSGFSRAVI
jgi:hypothetical protein